MSFINDLGEILIQAKAKLIFIRMGHSLVNYPKLTMTIFGTNVASVPLSGAEVFQSFYSETRETYSVLSTWTPSSWITNKSLAQSLAVGRRKGRTVK